MQTLPFRGTGQQVQGIAFAYQAHADAQAAQPVRHPVVVVGAGPVGLSLAIDLAQRGQRVVVLDNDHKLSSGSRAICFAKRARVIAASDTAMMTAGASMITSATAMYPPYSISWLSRN